MKTIFGFCLRFCYQTIAWCIVILAIALALLNLALRGLLIYEDDLVSWASESFGVPIEAKLETTRWLGSRPEIFVSQVVFGESDSAVRVSQLVAEPNLLRSLLSLSPSWERLQLSDVDIVIQEKQEGGWQIAGIDLLARSGNQGTGLERMLLSSSNILLSDIRLSMQFHSGAAIELQLDSAQIENGLGFHRLVADAQLDDDDNQVQLIVELTGISNRFSGLDGRAYLKLDGTDLSAPLSSVVERYTQTPLVLDSTPSVSGEIWANVASGAEVEFQGRIEVASMPGEIFSDELENLHFRSDLSGHLYYFDEELALDFIQPDFSTSNRQWPLDDFRLTRRHLTGISTYSLQMQSFDLEAISARVSELYALPERALQIVSDLDPSGYIQDLEVSLQSQNPIETLTVYADLNNVDVGHFKRAPAVRNLSGSLMANAFSGTVQVDSENLSLAYQTLYDHWLDHGSAKGGVSWTFDTEQRQIAIFGKDLFAETADGRVRGAFLIDAPTYQSDVGMDLYLDLGIQQADAKNWPKFLPRGVPASLNNWLTSADLAGQVTEGAIIYRGKVRNELVHLRSYQVRLAAEEAEVGYLDTWPKLTQAKADVLVSNRDLFITAPQASMPGIQVNDIDVQVDTTPGGLLQLTGIGVGETNALLNLVRQTGLRNRVGDSLDLLQFDGSSQVDITLALPIKNDLLAEDVDIDLSISLQENQLTLADQNLIFDDIAGTLKYGDQGLSGDQLQATLWSEPLSFSILEEQELGVVNVTSDGWVSMDAVGNWLGVNFSEYISGRTRVDSLLQIATENTDEQQSRYLILSDMVGIESQLPGGLSKLNEEASEFQLLIELSDTQELSLDWSKGLKLHFRKSNDSSLPRGEFESAVFSFDQELPDHELGKFSGQIFLDEVNIDDWMQQLPLAGGSDQTPKTIFGLSPNVSLSTNNIIYGEKVYGGINVGLQGIDNGWRFSFENSFVEGAYLHPYHSDTEANSDLAPTLALAEFNADKYFEMVSPGLSEQPEDDDTVQFDPRTVPALDVVIDNLVYKESSKGSWSAELRPSAEGLDIQNLKCSYRSLSCGVDGESSLYWMRDEQGDSSALALGLEYQDVSDVFDIAGIESPLISESGSFYASIIWDASPQKILESPLSGVLGMQLSDGEFKADPGSVGAGILRLIGLVNIDTWLRRLQLDFSDVAAEGTAYDLLGGDFTINDSVINTLTPVYVDMPSGRMLFDGAVNLDQNEVDAQLVVTLPARQNMAWIAALAGGLPAAVGVWVVGQIFDDELDSLASVSYRVTGPLTEPAVRTERVFDATVQE